MAAADSAQRVVEDFEVAEDQGLGPEVVETAEPLAEENFQPVHFVDSCFAVHHFAGYPDLALAAEVAVAEFDPPYLS